MPVTPTPPTLLIDIPEEHSPLLEMACESGGLSPQEVMRDALAMLQPEGLIHAALVEESRSLSRKKKTNPEHVHLAAWDSWTAKCGQQLPLSGALAEFVKAKIEQGGYPDATAVVMVALLRYAKVKGFGFLPDDGDSK
jgi:type II secretory pathway component PulL